MLQVFRSKVATLVLIAVVGWLGISTWHIRVQRQAVGQQLTNLESKIEGIERENEMLREQVSFMENNEYLARLARLKLNVKLPDEQVAYVYPKDEKPASPSNENTEKGVMEKIKEWWYDLVR